MALEIQRAQVNGTARYVELKYADQYALVIYDLNKAAEKVRSFYERSATEVYGRHEYATVNGYPRIYPRLFSSFEAFYACLMKYAYRRETLPVDYPMFDHLNTGAPISAATSTTVNPTIRITYPSWTAA